MVIVGFLFSSHLLSVVMSQACKVVHDSPKLPTPCALKAQSSAYLDIWTMASPGLKNAQSHHPTSSSLLVEFR